MDDAQETPDASPDPAGPPPETEPRGVDVEGRERPGVPMEAEPEPFAGAHWKTPPRQAWTPRSAVARGRPTPVMGTAQPLRGVSGTLRRAAYRLPEHRGRHWLLLLLADRVDVAEDRAGRLLASPLRAAGLGGAAERVRRNPASALALGAALGLAGVLLRRRLR